MSPSGVNASEYRQREIARADAQPLRVRCAFCPWTYRGTAAQAREAALSHRLLKHPEAKRTRRKPARVLGAFRQAALDAEGRAEIEMERRARALTTGVDLTD